MEKASCCTCRCQIAVDYSVWPEHSCSRECTYFIHPEFALEKEARYQWKKELREALSELRQWCLWPKPNYPELDLPPINLYNLPRQFFNEHERKKQ